MRERKLYQAISSSMLGKIILFISQFILTMIYVRLFTPTEFGIYAIVGVFVVFFQLISEFGIGPAIINKGVIKDEERNGIFSFTIILGLILAFLFYSCSSYISDFYGEYDYENIILIICISILFNSASIIPTTALNKDSIFFKVAIFQVIIELCVLVLIYKLAYLGVVALAMRTTAVSMLRFITLWFYSKYTTLGRAEIGTEINHIKGIYSFSMYQFGFNVINYFSRNLDNLLIGKFFGVTALGYYDKAYNLMRYPLVLTSMAMAPAIQPTLSPYKNDVEFIYDEHAKLSGRLLAFSVLISSFLYFNAESIILFAFGEQWTSSIVIVEIFAIVIPVQSIGSCSGAFYQVMDKPKALFCSGLFTAIINSIGIIIGVYSGSVESVAWGVLISFHISFIVNFYIIRKWVYDREMKSFIMVVLSKLKLVLFPFTIYIIVEISAIHLGYSMNIFFDFLFCVFLLSSSYKWIIKI